MRKASRFLLPAFGFFVIAFHLLANSTCSSIIDLGTAGWERLYESPFTYVAAQEYSLVGLVSFVCRSILFLSAPAIHLVFIANVLLIGNWKELWIFLVKIEKKLKLNMEFHNKCRRHCFVALVVFFLVIYIQFSTLYCYDNTIIC